MKCAYHSNRDSKTQCNSCKKYICEECSIPIKGVTYCKTCVSEERIKKTPQQYPYPYPYPYPYYYPHPYYQPPPQYPPSPPLIRRDSTGTFIVCGTLLIMVGILGLLSPIITFSLYLPSIPIFGTRDISAPVWTFICFILPLIFSVFSILGGLSILNRKNFQLGLMGAIFGILSWGFYIGAFVSFIVLLVLIFSYDEFIKKPKRV